MIFYVGVAFCAYGAVAYLLYANQTRLIFVATREINRTPAHYRWAYEDVKLNVGEETTHGWFIPAAEPAPGVILFSHGNAGNIADRLESISIFRDLGYDILAYDYGGYGLSTGTPSERRCYEDIRAMWHYLTETRGIPPNRIVLFGRSLGSGPTCELATEVRPAGVVLESAFMSIPKRAQEMYRFLPVTWLLHHRFDNFGKIPFVRSPILIAHSPDDTLIPIHHGKALFERANEPKAFLEFSGEHNEGFWMSGDVYTDGLRAFIDPLVKRVED